MSQNPPGWYRDPAEPTTQRYWDGDGWIGDPLPVDATPPEGPPVIAPPEPVVEPSSTPPGALPPGFYPPGTYPPGAYPPGALPPGAYPPGAMPPGAYPPGAYPPGMPPGAYPPAAYRPGQFPPGVVPPTSGGPTESPTSPTHPAPPAGGAVGAPPTGPPPSGSVPPGGPPPGMYPPGWPAGQPYPYGPYVLVPEPRPHGYALAPLGRRFAARMIDIGAVLVLNVFANGVLVYRFIKHTKPYWDASFAFIRGGSKGEAPTPWPGSSTWLLAILAVAMLVWLVYEVPATANSGQTLGKRLVGIRVMPLESTKRLGFGRSLVRWLPMGLPILAWSCLIGFVVQFFDSLSPVLNRPLHLATHDRFAATVVVSATKPEPGDGPPIVDTGGKA